MAKAKKNTKNVKRQVGTKVKKVVKKTTKKVIKRAAAARGSRLSWLDEEAQTPRIERYARQLGSFLDAMADGMVDESEVKAQEKRLVKLMKEIEPQLDDAVHEKITRLLCELTAYDLMQVLHSMQAARPKSAFQG